jgi:hypothetical protein
MRVQIDPFRLDREGKFALRAADPFRSDQDRQEDWLC